jgi:Zn-dependent peptidase ImmA (M78 family)
VSLPRGFKANAEREAALLRKEMGLGEADRLDMYELAEHMKVTVVDGADLIGRERLEEIEHLQAYAFSAATFEIQGRNFIVTNPVRSDARLASDLAHELAHIRLKHELTEVRMIDGHAFRTCQPDEEEQATTFGGTLLLPRPLLRRAAFRGAGPEQIAAMTGVTVDMARFRYNTTGVAKQTSLRG